MLHTREYGIHFLQGQCLGKSLMKITIHTNTRATEMIMIQNHSVLDEEDLSCCCKFWFSFLIFCRLLSRQCKFRLFVPSSERDCDDTCLCFEFL